MNRNSFCNLIAFFLSSCFVTSTYAAVVINEVSRDIRYVHQTYNPNAGNGESLVRIVTDNKLTFDTQGLITTPGNNSVEHTSFVTEEYINAATWINLPSSNSFGVNDTERKQFKMVVDFTVTLAQSYSFDFYAVTNKTKPNKQIGEGQKAYYKIENTSSSTNNQPLFYDVTAPSVESTRGSFKLNTSGTLDTGDYRLTFFVQGIHSPDTVLDFSTHSYITFKDIPPTTDIPLPTAAWLFGSALLALLFRKQNS